MRKPLVMEASAAKNAFGTLGARVKPAPVEVTRHGKLEFVVISPELYQEVKLSRSLPSDELGRMQASFDQLVSDMQSPKSEAAYAALDALGADQLQGAVASAYKQRNKLPSGVTPKRTLRVVA